MTVLAVLEQTGGVLNPMSLETLAAAQQCVQQGGGELHAALSGHATRELAGTLANYELGKIYAVEHPLLQDYTADGYAAALQQLIEQVKPKLILFPHTYQVRDFAPKLATALRRVLVSDVVAMRFEGEAIILVRQLFQGKVNADVRFTGAPPCFVSLQAGAWRADSLRAGSAAVEVFTPALEAAQIRSKPRERFRESARSVDLSTAPLIVSVGRGIKDSENLPMIERLAAVLGAQLAASRPICDNGWLPMERQVGSSGQTVAPKAYFAIGISGAIQHLVGMKGAKTVIAINRDPEAPIFEIADYGIVGDLFEIVPALTEALAKEAGTAKG